MDTKHIKQLYRRIRRTWQKLDHKKRRTIGLAVAAAIVLIFIIQGATRPMIDPSAYVSLLNTIAKGESGGNYNAYFGNANNTELQFTNMTVAEVMRWQEEYVRQGNASNAVGRYQIISTTLAGLVRQLRINSQTKFDDTLQDRLAIALIERRGSHAFVQKKISREQFAANLAMEWAALPRMIGEDPHKSYYAGDGLNHARITIEEILQAIDNLRQSN